MKPATVALLILVNMMCTISYFDHASFLGTKAEETTLLPNFVGSNEGTSSTKGINPGRKLMDSIDNSHRWFPITKIEGLMNNPPHH
ncbi:hypothetical protein BDA96_06G027400 [Sorghum bicolor]|uniref:Uncharacterized protein n=2 Tax=Sorghum bicolor TaxID=4558 RepID=A0A921QN38_SORBI|nr:hypothetical protein BDA96_06G027400 [Sorghum bicolor]KAG0525113.1 hypothetical protein BDA96_06G027400 [Sorghum bicolor]KXG25884.1 hypothetical protein SORBI_3006G025900 [Sorghum bicolor]KXG25885.1 hypothetical protein SORBI_3006G025900 [Sorghum bicolor]